MYRSGSGQVDPARADPNRPDPTRTDPTQPDPARHNPTRLDPTRPGTTRPGPIQLPHPTQQDIKSLRKSLFFSRTLKRIFFKLLLRYPTQNYQTLLSLTENLYNNETRRNLQGFSAYRCHFDTHIASLVFRARLRIAEKHQEKAVNTFKKISDNQKLAVNDQVRIRNAKKVIQKESGVFNPTLQSEVHIVSHIDREKLPYVYSLKDHKKKFYIWHLSKTHNATEPHNEPIRDTGNNIEVLSATAQQRQLRSRGVDTKNYMYKVLKNNKTQILTEEDLKLQKKIFGKNILNYSPFFRDRQDLVI